MIEIVHRYTRETLYRSEDAETLRAAVEQAVRSGADLGGAYLGDANLRGAYLGYANLRDAHLRNAHLRNAYLRNADLRDADLRNADLRDADLRNADLRDAHLRNADLRGARGIDGAHTTPLYALHDQPGAIRMYKLVRSDGTGPFNGGITYKVGGEYSVEDADTDPHVQCGAGINLASLDWCLREWRPGYRVLVAEHTAEDIAAIPAGSDGKYRVWRCRIVAEKDVSEWVGDAIRAAEEHLQGGGK